MKKVAPPGRRSSSRVKKFSAETAEVEPIDGVPTEQLQEVQQPPAEEAVVEAVEQQEFTAEAHTEPVVQQNQVQEQEAADQDEAQQQELSSFTNDTTATTSHNGHHSTSQELSHIAASYADDSGAESDGDEADDADNAESEEAKAKALAMQQAAERLASQVKAEQEAADARRSQRLKFLGDVDDFVGTMQKEITSQPAYAQPIDVVAQALQDASKNYQPPPSAVVEAAEEPAVVRQPPPAEDHEVVHQHLQQEVVHEQKQEAVEEFLAPSSSEQNVASGATFNALASKLFADEPPATSTIELSSNGGSGGDGDEEMETKHGEDGNQHRTVLSRPTRIGMLDKQSKRKEPVSEPSAATTAGARQTHIIGQPSSSDADIMAAAKQSREDWMASQEDLHKKRTDFHGAVTYAFDGVFSWQMYGVTNATEADGSAYTEYIMRCQWGPDFESLKPWMVARRFREFHLLDEQLKAQFPDLKGFLPALPPKEFFASMSPDVIEKREKGLETYMTYIVTSLPTMLRGHTMDRFLHIKHWLRDFHAQLGISPVAAVNGNARGPIVVQEVKEAEIDARDFAAIMTSDDAQRACEEDRVSPLDYVGVGGMEEAVRSLSKRIQGVSPQTVTRDTELQNLLRYTQAQWPALKAACTVSETCNLELLPRALQCDEDLQRALAEYKSILAVKQLQGGIAV